MSEKKFDVRFDPDAVKEYNKIDNSIINIVDKAIDELEYRADEVGKDLKNNNETKLAGCKEIKLRDEGIRIVFKITNQVVEVLRVVYIYAIEKRSRDIVFKLADKRNKSFKALDKSKVSKHLSKCVKWHNNNKNAL